MELHGLVPNDNYPQLLIPVCVLFHSIQHSGGAQALPPSNKNYAVKIIRRSFLYDYSTGVQWPAPKKDNILGDQCQAPAR